MNKTLLLIICDFLLLNLIHFTAWDNLDKDNSVAGAGGAETLGSGMGDPSEDLELVKFQLEQSKRERTATEEKLDKTQVALTQSEQENTEKEEELGNVKEKLGDKETALGNAEKMNLAILSEYEQFKEKAQVEAQQSNEENQKLINENKKLNEDLEKVTILANERKISADIAQENAKQAISDRNKARKEASDARNEANAAKEVAATANANAARANAVAIEAKARIKSADDRAQAAQTKVVEVEKDLATAQTTAKELSKTVESERKAKIVAQDASKQLRDEIQKDLKGLKEKPLLANEMAIRYDINHVKFNTQGKRSLSSPNYSTKTILIEAPTYDYDQKKTVPYVHAITHVDQTSLRIKEGALGWKETSGQLSKTSNKTHRLNHVRFLRSDPRIIIAPIGPPGSVPVKALGVEPFKLPDHKKNPRAAFKYPKAFLMKKDGQNFGEVVFQRDLKNPDYVKMDKSFIRSTFMGEFNPTRGDLVFSQTGELLGIMANSQYCHLIKSVDPVGAVVFGKNDYSKVAKTLRDMHKLVAAKPSELR
jgi:membrane protein involved in colicin uptake